MDVKKDRPMLKVLQSKGGVDPLTLCKIVIGGPPS